jgi:CheY-like chemotaxis protein
MEDYEWDVFVSHNRKQKPWVRKMVSQWRSLKLRVFFDEDSIEPGEDIVAGVERGLRGSRYIVFMISPAAVKSSWVAMETACAVYEDPDSSKRRIIPILIEPTPIESIRPIVRRLRNVDLTDSSRQIANYQHLLRFLGVRSEPLPCPPDFHKSLRVKGDRPPCTHELTQDTLRDVHLGDAATMSEVWPVEIKINRPFDEYTEHERHCLLSAIGAILDVTGRITVVSQRRGCVCLTINVPADKAEMLVNLANSGALQAYNVTDAHIVRTIAASDESSEQHRLTTATKTMFTTGEVATICRMTQQSIIRCFDSGRLEGFRVPGSRFRRIPRQSLIKFMKDNSIPLDNLETGRKRVLIVDDDAEIVELMADVLTRDGRFEIKTASSGYEAGISTQQFRPDLILLDYMLPDVNGNVVCQTIKRNPEFENTKVIIVSGVVKQDEIDQLFKSGAEGFIRKPFRITELTDKVTAALKMRSK